MLSISKLVVLPLSYLHPMGEYFETRIAGIHCKGVSLNPCVTLVVPIAPGTFTDIYCPCGGTSSSSSSVLSMLWSCVCMLKLCRDVDPVRLNPDPEV